MKVSVTKDKVSIIEKDIVHAGEYNINHIEFEFSAEYTADLVKNAVFSIKDNVYQTSIINDQCDIPAEILSDFGEVVFGVYAYKVNDDQLELRYSPFPARFTIISGSYDPTAEESEEITPSQFEQYMQAMNDGLNKVEASIKKMDSATSSATKLVDEINQKLENGDFIGPPGPQGIPGKNGTDGVGITTITSGQSTVEEDKTITPITVNKTDGSSQIFKVEAKNGLDGQNGKDGKDGVNGQDGLTPTIGENGNWFLGDTDTGKPSRGEVGPSPDLSNYVKNTDYATNNKTGVINGNINGFQVSSSGNPYAKEYTAEEYDNVGNQDFIGKGTLENIKDDYVGSSTPVKNLNTSLIDITPKNNAEGTDNVFDDGLESPLFALAGDGKSEQVVTTGKNLLPYPYVDTTKTENGITFTDNGDGTITVNGTATAGAFFKVFATQTNQEEIPGNYISGSATGCAVVVAHKQDTTYTTLGASSNGNSSLINKETYAIGYIELSISQGTTLNNVIVKPMLTLEQDTSYEPYTGGQPSPSPDYPQEINSIEGSLEFACRKKNLFDVNNTMGILVDTSIDEEGWITVNIDNSEGTATKFINIWTHPNYNILPNKSYKLVLEIKSHSGSDGYLAAVSDDSSSPSQFKNQYQYRFKDMVDNSITIYDIVSKESFDKSKNMIRTFIASSIGSTQKLVFRISVIDDDKVTPQNFKYEPYVEPNEVTFDLGQEKLRSVGDVKDELVVDLSTGDYFKIENIGEVVFDGSDDENFVLYSPENTIMGFTIPLFTSNPINQYLQSNYFRCKNTYYTWQGYGYFGVNNTGTMWFQTDSNFSSVEEFKQWLSKNNVYVDYQLTTPTTKKLGTLSAEDLAKLKTFKGYNNVTVNTNLGLMNIRFTYGLDIKKYVDNKIAELSAQMIEEG